MARKTKFDKIDLIMGSAAMSEQEKNFSHAKIDKNSIYEIKIKNIVSNPYQPRLQMNKDELMELAKSIEENGLLQPILLNRVGEDKYELIAGHRRLEAHKILKKETIKAIIVSDIKNKDAQYKNKMSINALVENMQRQNLDLLEIALSMQNLLNEKIFKTKSELAKSLGKTITYVSKILSIINLDNRIIKDLEKNKSIKDLESLYELQKIDDKEKQYKFYLELINGKITREYLREYNKKLKSKDNTKNSKKIPYSLKVNKSKLILNTDLKNLDEEKRKNFEEEIKQVINKYFKYFNV